MTTATPKTRPGFVHYAWLGDYEYSVDSEHYHDVTGQLLRQTVRVRKAGSAGPGRRVIFDHQRNRARRGRLFGPLTSDGVGYVLGG